MDPYTVATDRHPRLLGVFAHPDDEIFCAGGTLALWAAAGGETMVISATRGEAGQIQDGYAATRHTLGAVREQELLVACARLGVQRVECLDYRDGTLQEVDEATLAREVAARIRELDPDVVVTFGPDGGYGHPDHVAISAATTRACQQIAQAGGHAPHLYYSAFPRQHRLLCFRLARWLVQRDTPFSGSDAFVRALALLAEEAVLLGHADDTVEVRWYPAGMSIVEQGEPGTGLYLIISGHADVIEDGAGGTQRVSRRVGPGQFFGEDALARHQPYGASLVATDTVTCLVLSAHAPTPFDGRGSEAQPGGAGMMSDGDETHEASGLTRLDVSAWLDHKISALAAHRTQFLMEAATFPTALLEQWLGSEYFVRVAISTAERTAATHAALDAFDQAAQWAIAVPA